jgi:hypothetical protein
MEDRKMRWAENVSQMRRRGKHVGCCGGIRGKGPFERPTHRWVDKMKMDLREKELDDVD